MTTLQPGDVLLYPAKGFYGKLIALKTWHPIAHVEISLGPSESVASRDGVGVGKYPARLGDIKYILRPNLPFNRLGAMAYFATVQGQPYGWLDLLQFVGLNVDSSGMVCSPFATEFLRAGGVPVFKGEPAIKVAPCTFLLSELLDDVTDSVLT